jgi:hypothetical protein
MSQRPPVWTSENGALLQQLRINAKMDIGTLAQRNMVSRSQVLQLEEGGDSSFYSPEIKYHVGKKLIGFFGHTLVPKRPVEVQVQTESADSNSQRELTNNSGTAQPALHAAPSKQTEAEPATSTPAPAKSSSPALKKIGLGALVVSGLSVLLLGFFNGGSLDAEPAKPVNNQAVNQVVQADPAPAISSPLAKPAEAPLAETAATSATPTAPPAAATNNDAKPVTAQEPVAVKTAATPAATSDAAKKCSWKDSEIELQASSPKKAAEYVYMVASNDLFVCVMDGNERVAGVAMKKGESRSIYGAAPFKVQSADMAQLKVFFQGQPISLPSAEVRQIKLTAAAWK